MKIRAALILAVTPGPMLLATAADRLLAPAKGTPDVERVLSNLQAASRDRHLLAFRRAVEQGGKFEGRGGGAGAGRGFGRGAGCGCGGGCGLGPVWRQSDDESATPGTSRERAGNGRVGPPWPARS